MPMTVGSEAWIIGILCQRTGQVGCLTWRTDEPLQNVRQETLATDWESPQRHESRAERVGEERSVVRLESDNSKLSPAPKT